MSSNQVTGFSPIDILPDELFVCHIFPFYLSGDDREEDESSQSHLTLSVSENNRSSPLVLAVVCSRWRNMTIHAPSLWSYLAVRVGDQKNLLIAVNKWITRAKSSPLHLSVRQLDSTLHTIWNTRAILNDLIRKREKWKSIVLHLESPFYVFDDVSSSDFKMLESVELSIKYSSPWKHGKAQHLFTTLYSSASLRRFALTHPEISRRAIEEPLMGVAIPWGKLREIEITHPLNDIFEVSGLLKSLSQCSSLEHFILSNGKSSKFQCSMLNHAQALDEEYFFQRLKSMHFIHANESILIILNHITTPQLSYVRVHCNANANANYRYYVKRSLVDMRIRSSNLFEFEVDGHKVKKWNPYNF